MAFPKYQTKEVLNKVLNAGEDGLNVDLADSVTVTVDSEFPAAAAITDNFANPTTTSAMSMLMGYDGSAWDRVTIGGGTEAAALRVTIASDSTGVVSVDDGGGTLTVDGTVSVSGLLADGHAVTIDNTDSNEVYVRGSGTAGSADAKVLTVQGIASGTALAVTESSPISGFATATLQGAGLPSALSSDNLKVSIQEGGFDGVVTITDTSFAVADGNALGEGILVQGDDGSDRKNIHVDATTGDVQVDVTDIVPGYAATSLGKREDDPHSNLDTGVMALAVRNDDVAALASADNDYAPLQVNATGSLYTVDETGAAGSILVTGTGAITAAPSNSCFVAIQFLEDTIFDSTDGLIAVTEQLYPDDNGTGTTVSSSNGANTDGVTFPQGMTIFGRWSGFKLTATGAVIAYLGYESA